MIEIYRSRDVSLCRVLLHDAPLNRWRQERFLAAAEPRTARTVVAPDDPATPAVSSIVAAALCIKPRGLLTEPQATTVDRLKTASTEFAAMRFRGILRGADTDKLDVWLDDALRSGIHCMRQFAFKMRQNIAAVRKAILERWSNGQAEGRINRVWPRRHGPAARKVAFP